MSMGLFTQMPISTHRFSYDCIELARPEIFNGGYGTIDDVSTEYKTTGYRVTIKYEGPVDLKNRVIKEFTFPDYKKDRQVISEAETELADLKELHDAAMTCICRSFFLVFLCVPLCVTCYYVKKGVHQYEPKLQATISRISMERLQKGVTNLLKEADGLVTERIEHLESKKGKKSVEKKPEDNSYNGPVKEIREIF